MKGNQFDLNRPVHLARRDAYFERAAELLCTPVDDLEVHERLRRMNAILQLLNTAENHAFFAARSPSANDLERDFLHFLKMAVSHVESALTMTQQEAGLTEEESFLSQFLAIGQDECNMPAVNYRRRSQDILQGLWQLVRLALKPYNKLQSDISRLTGDDHERYQKAHSSFRRQLTREQDAGAYA